MAQQTEYMRFQNVLFVIALAIILLMVIPLRWILRKLRLRRAWSAIKSEREENRQAFARLAAQVVEFEQQWRPASKLDLPAFPDQQWRAIVDGGTAAMMRAEERREVEELYVDLARLRKGVADLSAAAERVYEAGTAAAGDTQRLGPVHGALGALVTEMRRFQPLHTDFVAVS